MPEGLGPQEVLGFWRAAQEGFWRATADAPNSVDLSCLADASGFADQDWLVFDTWLAPLIDAADDQTGDALADALRAARAWRSVIQGTFLRVARAFEIQRRALCGTGADLDWRMLRDRWFAIAEAEFIRTLRSDAFLAAQRDGLRAGIRLWQALPPSVCDMIRAQRQAGGAARQTLAAIGGQMVPIAETPKDLVWRDGKTSLWRYRSLGGRAPGLPPILLCHGLIGRQTMTDLRPERSLVRNLLAGGSDVFVIDWGNAGPEDAAHGLDHYVGHMIPALIRAATATAGTKKLVLFGICQGGTLAACHAARDASRLAGLITAVAPFDFDAFEQDADPAHGLLNLWLRSLEPSDITALIDMEGNLSGEFIGLMFQQLNPVGTLAKYAVTLVDTCADPHRLASFVAMENWLMDRPDLPGKLAREWLVDCYQENRLAKGQLKVLGKPVHLGTLRLPVLNVLATNDHISPAPCAQALGRLAPAAEIETLALPTGHIGAFVSSAAQPLLAPSILSWLSSDRFTTP